MDVQPVGCDSSTKSNVCDDASTKLNEQPVDDQAIIEVSFGSDASFDAIAIISYDSRENCKNKIS